MNIFRMKLLTVALLALGFAGANISTRGQTPVAARDTSVRIEAAEGVIEVMVPPSTVWIRTQTNQVLRPFYRVRTGQNSRATLRWSDASIVPMNELTEIEILPPHRAGAQPTIHILEGVASFFHRGKPGSLRTITRGSVAGVEGTEFVLSVEGAAGSQQTSVAVIDGIVTFSDPQGNGTLTLTNGQQAAVIEGQQPVLIAGFIAENLLQWACYYPAVLDLNDLPLTAAERERLAPSLAAYREGDLHAALNLWPADYTPQSNTEHIYHAALLLAVGQVPAAEKHIGAMIEPNAGNRRLAAALRLMAATASNTKATPIPDPQTATELLAASYHEQSRAVLDDSLRRALELARQAVERSPESGFGWARVAELEFSFGRTRETLAALNKSLDLAPRNAQAIALKGFVQAAQNRTSEALQTFNAAIAADSALGNAWLGRGLVRIRRGDRQAGREDLLIAAAIEPRRSLLRSYLAKAWNDGGDPEQALKELALAKRLDPADPTPWLYSALLHEQGNRLNDAIRDLERSKELNDNKRVYQSKLRLDGDRAVKGANLARIYDQAGIGDVAVRTAGTSVVDDYGLAEGHVFLAKSYDRARNSTPFEQRYETAAYSEQLLSKLLGPADARILAQSSSHYDYSSLLSLDGWRIGSSTEYRSRGAWQQEAALYGNLDNASYSLDAAYTYEPGYVADSELETWRTSLQWKQTLSPDDSVFVQALTLSRNGEDTTPHYDPNSAVPGFSVKERHEPDLLLGFHHRWSPLAQSVILMGRFDVDYEVRSPFDDTLLEQTYGNVTELMSRVDLDQTYRSDLQLLSFEAQHIQEAGSHTIVTGYRHQEVKDDVFSEHVIRNGNAVGYESYLGNADDVVSRQRFEAGSQRDSVYFYENWQLPGAVTLLGALTYDALRLPRNALHAPLQPGEIRTDAWSPKVGMLWRPHDAFSARMTYAEFLGGSDLDQSVRLEPAQFASMPLAYRTLFPDALVGGVSGARSQVEHLLFEWKPRGETFLSAGFQHLRSRADRTLGGYRSEFSATPTPFVTSFEEKLRYEESVLEVIAHQMVQRDWVFHLFYKGSSARMVTQYPTLDPNVLDNLDRRSVDRGILHQAGSGVTYRHPSGFFASASGMWLGQELSENLAELADENIWLVDCLAGYRSIHGRIEVSAGLANLLDKDYRIHPVNLTPAFERERTAVVRLRLNY